MFSRLVFIACKVRCQFGEKQTSVHNGKGLKPCEIGRIMFNKTITTLATGLVALIMTVLAQAFNQVVQGSSSCQLTDKNRYLEENSTTFSKHLCQIVPIPIPPEVLTTRVLSLTNPFVMRQHADPTTPKKNGKTSYTVRIRVLGYPPLTKTFSTHREAIS